MLILLINFIYYINSLKIDNILKNYKDKEQYSSITNDSYKQNFKINNEEIIEISNYERINPEDQDYFYIPIIGSSDIHGHFYPEEFETKNISYSRGGLDYLGKYINILRKEFKNNILYFDAGDMFKGGIESNITNGDIIIDYFNLIKADGVTIGNHEFDYDRPFLIKERNIGFPFIVSNIYDSKENTKIIFGINQVTSKIYTFNLEKNKIKIGVIGLTLKRDKSQIAGKGFDDIKFLDYKSELISEINNLKKENKLNAIILLSHIGLECKEENDMTLSLYKPSDLQENCNKDSELYKLLYSLDQGLIDAVITGHSHEEVHHFINNIPVISPKNKGSYSNIIYLAFDKRNDFKIAKHKIRIEGPLPICEKIFKKNHKCEFVKESELNEFLPLLNYKFHGILIEKELSLKPIHDKYDKLYKNYSEKICSIIGTENILTIETNGNFYIGNLIVDIHNNILGTDISIYSYGNLRNELYPGKIDSFKIKDIIPYLSNVCTFTMNGNEIIKMIKIIQTGKKKYFLISGLKQVFTKNKNGEYFLSNINYYDGYNEFELIPEKEYSISLNDYLIIKGGDGFNKVLIWYKPRNLNCNHGIDINLIENYLKDQNIIDIRKYMDDNNPRIRFID